MTAYGAVISLRNTVHSILHSSRLTLVHPSTEIMELVYEQVQPLQETLSRVDNTSKSLSRKKVNALDARITDRVREFEDQLESLVTDEILSQVERDDEAVLFSIDLQYLQDDAVACFIQSLKDMEKEYIDELQNMPQDADDDDHQPSVPSTVSSNMVGLSDQLENLKQEFFVEDLWRRYRIFALLGTAGVGKTTLAKRFYQDPDMARFFKLRVWLAVGRTSRFADVPRRILAQLDPNMHGVLELSDGEISECLKERMEGRNCLIVLDDVWDEHVLDSLASSLPVTQIGYVDILLTARDRSVVAGRYSSVFGHDCTVVRFLEEEESKELLCEKVFGLKTIPHQLDEAATKIAKRCEGLPLLIITVARHLSESQKRDDPQYWDDVAEYRNSVFMDAHNEISKVLYPSYNYLPQYLKTFLLFLGVFPSDYRISPSKINNMLSSEGWLLDSEKEELSLEDYVFQCLECLFKVYNLVLASARGSFWHCDGDKHIYKTCRLHCSWRHLCRGEARKNKFFNVLNKLVEAASKEAMEGQRGLCLENNILFGIKEFCNSVQCYSASSTRSLLFYGPYHQYPIPIHVTFKLLKELDALNLRFYSFPDEILTLVQLKYLALTCNGEVPTTISKLFHLRILIIHPHMRIQRCGFPPSIPMQIWDMQDLEHVEIMGRIIEAPKHGVASLLKLSTLVGVTIKASFCTILELFKRLPKIRKLGVEVELAPPDDETNSLTTFFHHISALENLKTLKCSIINPWVKHGYSSPSSFMVPRGLVKLHLSGIGFPWEYMDAIGALPSLQVLKLRSYACKGSKWEAREQSFLGLRFLLIEDSDLVQWKAGCGSFPLLSCLRMKYCYRLEEFQWPNKGGCALLQLLDCNPLAVNCAEKIQSENRNFIVTVYDHFEA